MVPSTDHLSTDTTPPRAYVKALNDKSRPQDALKSASFGLHRPLEAARRGYRFGPGSSAAERLPGSHIRSHHERIRLRKAT